jgi:hypothetical protein
VVDPQNSAIRPNGPARLRSPLARRSSGQSAKHDHAAFTTGGVSRTQRDRADKMMRSTYHTRVCSPGSAIEPFRAVRGITVRSYWWRSSALGADGRHRD